eukprot:TRINITY_DN106648_c0_g1_i1.p1 TRINITY_DN106648_c0_g1~~TRINITY_DN106648_c0_g1_i1.p1  ORF type:complete len:572 (-),score=42.86 TRINITY_DN106648_c0_g1_i1:650-2113(-)
MNAQIVEIANVVTQLSQQMSQNVTALQHFQALIQTQQVQPSPFSNQQMVMVQQPQVQVSPYPVSISQTPSGSFFLPNAVSNVQGGQQQYQLLSNKIQMSAVQDLSQKGQQTYQQFVDISNLEASEKHQKGIKRGRSFPDISDKPNIIRAASMQQRNTVHGAYVALSQLTNSKLREEMNVASQQSPKLGSQGSALKNSPMQNEVVNNGQDEAIYDDMLASLWPDCATNLSQQLQQGVVESRDEVSRSISSRESEGAGNDCSFIQQSLQPSIHLSGKKNSFGTMRLEGMKYHCGKDLTYAVIKKYFDRSLKQAAVDLGVCPTTLKRACRRIGIHRWPARQVRKMYKTIQEYTHISDMEKQKLRDQLDSQVKSHLLMHGQLACGVRLVENSFMEGSSIGEEAQIGEEGTVTGGKALQNIVGYRQSEALVDTNTHITPDQQTWISNQVNDLLQNGITTNTFDTEPNILPETEIAQLPISQFEEIKEPTIPN